MTPALTSQERPTREFAISVLHGNFRELSESLPEEIASMSLDALEEKRKPTETDYFLRKNLWKQVELAQKGIVSHITPAMVYGGICSKQNFDYFVKTPLKLAWLLTYPEGVQERLEAGLSIALTNLLKFVSKEPTAETAGAFIKATEILLNRVQGPIIQKIQAQHAHMNLNKPMASQLPHGADRLEELKAKLVQPRDVSPVKAE